MYEVLHASLLSLLIGRGILRTHGDLRLSGAKKGPRGLKAESSRVGPVPVASNLGRRIWKIRTLI
jgi:hypothetical protein